MDRTNKPWAYDKDGNFLHVSDRKEVALFPDNSTFDHTRSGVEDT